MESYHADENKNQPQSEAQKIKDEKATKAYVQLFVELSATSLLSSSTSDPTAANKLVKALDFMAVISSVLLLSDSVNIETKVNITINTLSSLEYYPSIIIRLISFLIG